MIDKALLGERIKEIRVKRKETLDQFAKKIRLKTDNKIKTTKSNVSKWEKGENIPNDVTLQAIADLGKTTVGWLSYGSYDDYAEYLLTTLEKELIEKNSVSDKVVPFIISDMRRNLFPFLHDYKTTAEADKIYNEYKPILIKRWTDPSSIEHYLIDNARKRITDIIVHDTIPYMYTDFYTESNPSNISGDKLTKKSETLIRKLHDLDNLQRVYMDSLRFIDNADILNELDKLNEFTEKNTF